MDAASTLVHDVRARVAAYYARKLARHGVTPLGVDWSCVPTQQLRFVQLLKVCDFSRPFSLNDVGCGYGALLQYLGDRHAATGIDYLGIDLSAAMIRRARRRWAGRGDARFVLGHASPRVADFTVASGVFNVKLDCPIDLWRQLTAQALTNMRDTSRRGFAVNFMTFRPHHEATHLGLYRTFPGEWISYCETRLGLEVELLSDYGMHEFTLLITPRDRGASQSRRARSRSSMSA